MGLFENPAGTRNHLQHVFPVTCLCRGTARRWYACNAARSCVFTPQFLNARCKFWFQYQGPNVTLLVSMYFTSSKRATLQTAISSFCLAFTKTVYGGEADWPEGFY